MSLTPSRLYAIIVVVVAFSVIVQGGLVPTVAARLGVPMRTVEPEPWSLGVRFRQEPRGLRRHLVAAGSPADGCRIADLEVGEDVWISFVIRDDQLVPVRGSTILQAGDEILALTDPERGPDLAPIFTPRPDTGAAIPHRPDNWASVTAALRVPCGDHAGMRSAPSERPPDAGPSVAGQHDQPDAELGQTDEALEGDIPGWRCRWEGHR